MDDSRARLISKLSVRIARTHVKKIINKLDEVIDLIFRVTDYDITNLTVKFDDGNKTVVKKDWIVSL